MNITVTIKDQYGCRAVHPVCETAKLFAQLAGTKTLTNQALSTIAALGYAVLVEQQTITI
jgi:hypothetical protein